MKQPLPVIQAYAPADRHTPIFLQHDRLRAGDPSATTLIGEQHV